MDDLRKLLAALPLDIPWSQYDGTIFGRHVGEGPEMLVEFMGTEHPAGDVPCRITTGGFDDEAAAELAIAAVNALPALLDIAEAARVARDLFAYEVPSVESPQRQSAFEKCRRDLEAALGRLEEGK